MNSWTSRLSFSMAVLVLLGQPAQAGAEAARHRLGMSVGLGANTVRDDLLVPLAFSGPGLHLAGRYAGDVGPGLLLGRLEVGLAGLWNRFGHMGGGVDYGLGASWLLGVAQGAGWRFSLGPALGHDVSAEYLGSWDDAHGYWMGAQWLGVSGRWVSGLGHGWRMEATPIVSLLGARSRPPSNRFVKIEPLDSVSWWLRAPTADPSFVTVAQMQLLRLDLALRPSPLDAPDVVAGWSFGVDSRAWRTAEPKTRIGLASIFYAAYDWEL